MPEGLPQNESFPKPAEKTPDWAEELAASAMKAGNKKLKDEGKKPPPAH